MLGFTRVEWEGPEHNILHFLIWTSLDRRGAVWHQGRVVKKLSKSRGGYTHDAVLDGVPLSQKRGVVLSQEGYDAGCWVLLELADDSSEDEAPADPSRPCVAGPSAGR